jgi:formate dehydrogenase alpha subunit
MISLTIDERALQVAPGTSVLHAAKSAGIEIPNLCHHPELRPNGGCRLCIVEVEGKAAPAPSCGLPCEEGMVVSTQSERLQEMRREIIDLLISDHPLRCVTCDKSGGCDLQRFAYDLGLSETTYDVEISRSLYQDDNPMFVRDHQYCILCGKCVRVCDEIVGASAIEISGRGFTSHVATPFDWPMAESACVFCGNCVQVCPTAALMPRSRIGQGREWELSHTDTVCGYCGVGCRIDYALRDGKILYAQGTAQAPVNGEFLCAKGRFGWDFAAHGERLTRPLIRRDLAHELGLTPEAWEMPTTSVLDARMAEDSFIPVDWDTALGVVARRLAKTVKEHGPDAVAGLTSARCTNEENYLFQKLMRASIGTNNVDHCARLCHSSTVTGLVNTFGSGAMTNAIREIRDADCILITGSNTAESHPVISYEVIRAVKKGATLIVIDPRRVPLARHATLFLQVTPGADIYVFMSMMSVILRNGWADAEFIAERTEGFEAFVPGIEDFRPQVASLASGVPADLIEKAAEMYALGKRVQGPSVYPEERGHSSILYAMGVTQRSIGTQVVMSLANLAMMSGQIGKPSTGVNPLRGQSNVQGACDMGGLPNYLPGYQLVTDEARRKAVAAAWGVPSLPSEPGLTVVEIMQAAEAGNIRAMYVMGENPMLSDPNLSHVEHGLRELDFLVVQDIFLSETAQLAHVVLPAASWLEKDGTKTNTERRVQLLRPVLQAPGEALPDWKILCALGHRLDEALGIAQAPEFWDFASTAEVLDEARKVTPSYRGIRHARLGMQGLTWPCPSEDHPGTPILHTTSFTRGKGHFAPIESRSPAELPDDEYPLILTTGRSLYHYHTGTMTRRSEALSWRDPRGHAEINTQDAERIGIRDAGPVVIASRRGQVRTQARVGNRVPPGVVFLAFHWREAPANLLTQDFALDPEAKIPEYKVCAVRLEAPKRGRA